MHMWTRDCSKDKVQRTKGSETMEWIQEKGEVPVTGAEEDRICIPQQQHPMPILLPPALSKLQLW
jgi:hypothetical protein